MDASVIGSSSVNLGRITSVGLCNIGANLNANILSGKNSYSKGFNLVENQRFLWHSRYVALSLRASASAQSQPILSDKASKTSRNRATDATKLFVGLPLDTISTCNSINHPRAIAAGLKALKLLGVDGVELPIWWGIAENEAMGKYDWRGYLEIVEMVKSLDLELHVSLCFHASVEAKISLPGWVSRIGESDRSIYYTDRSGYQYKDCLSLGVDGVPILDGKTPIQVYGAFFESFKSVFQPFIGSTITGLTVGLGPDGELRYPSHHQPKTESSIIGAGEFQCYDANMLSHLNLHAENTGNPLWGLGGPHDAPAYNDPPLSGTFFAENGGAWESPYGDFFLSWYSNQLISHGDRILSLAHSTFEEFSIPLSARIPLLHAWSKSRSRPSELTAGFYNGYESIAEMFARNSCRVILPGLDLSENLESWSSPEQLIAEITSCCRKHETCVSGENAWVCGDSRGFEEIKKRLGGENGVDLFTYQRMGADLFSPRNFPLFTRFVRGLNESEAGLSADDLPVEKEEIAKSLNLQMQLV